MLFNKWGIEMNTDMEELKLAEIDQCWAQDNNDRSNIFTIENAFSLVEQVDAGYEVITQINTDNEIGDHLVGQIMYGFVEQNREPTQYFVKIDPTDRLWEDYGVFKARKQEEDNKAADVNTQCEVADYLAERLRAEAWGDDTSVLGELSKQDERFIERSGGNITVRPDHHNAMENHRSHVPYDPTVRMKVVRNPGQADEIADQISVGKVDLDDFKYLGSLRSHVQNRLGK